MSDVYTPPAGSSVLPELQDVDPEADRDTAGFYGVEYRFDFLMGDLVPGADPDEDAAETVSAGDAVLQSIEKALSTPRGKHIAYSLDYGNEMWLAVADPPVGMELDMLALSYAAECIDTDPRIETTDDLFAEVDELAGTATITGTIHTTFGDVLDLDVTFPYVFT